MNWNEIDDISVLSNVRFPNLTELDLDNNPDIDDISPLRMMYQNGSFKTGEDVFIDLDQETLKDNAETVEFLRDKGVKINGVSEKNLS